jgi:hypothetical protein
MERNGLVCRGSFQWLKRMWSMAQKSSTSGEYDHQKLTQRSNPDFFGQEVPDFFYFRDA